ncbi:MAG: Dna2/Cas4 domain-containing protein [Canidatus Methanoxibalbensis ujae]|nr:Dna2/Cas4 domain-containing protein [Candidatus Methanoxibalbensis ujae]
MSEINNGQIKDMRGEVKVSDISTFFLCPRILYFKAQQSENTAAQEARMRRMTEKMLLRELAFKLPETVKELADCGEKEEVIENLAQSIMEDLRYVYSDNLRYIDDNLLREIHRDFIEYMKRSQIIMKSARSEIIKTEIKHGFIREHLMFSSKLRMSGCVDKMIEIDNEEKVPCIIRTGKSPEMGVWASDRASLAAYAFLIEESYNITVSRGFVEYIRDASFRATVIRRKDRAVALHALKRVRAIKSGKFPEKGDHAPCHLCIFNEHCNVKGETLLSKLLRL